MPKQISIASVVEAALRGVIDAQNQYDLWSGGDWLWNAPEYLITTSIASKIASIDGSKLITLENGASTAIVDAGAKGKGRLHNHIRQNGKVDILLWWADGSPRAIIEVKNQIYYSGQFEADIKRIKQFLKRKSRESSFQFGLFVFYHSAQDGSRKSGPEKIEAKIKSIQMQSKELLGVDFNATLYKSKINIVDNSAWASACLLLKYNSTEH